jgi:predicted metal-binding protein
MLNRSIASTSSKPLVVCRSCDEDHENRVSSVSQIDLLVVTSREIYTSSRLALNEVSRLGY